MTHSARPVRRPAPRHLQLFVQSADLRRITVVSLAIGLSLAPWYEKYSLWIGVGVALTVFVAWHSIEASREIPWIPGLTITAACIQWIVAPWIVYIVEVDIPLSAMPLPADEYFRFAVPATLALVAGILLPLRRYGRTVSARPVITPNRGFRMSCEVMVFVGLLARLFLVPVVPSSLRFAAYLVAALSTVGVCGLLLSNSPGWYWRAAALLVTEGFFNTLDAQFLDVMLLIGFLAVMFVYRFRVSSRAVVGLVTAAIVGLLAINAVKRVYRAALGIEEVVREERLGTASSVAAGIASSPKDIFSSENLFYNLSRLNQGAIIGRVMVWVPTYEPFAGGETITTALRSSAIPRFFDADKPRAGGFENYKRFTGYGLVGATSINLGMAGEMYANFGRWGGVAAVGLYGITLGWVFALLVRWTARSPLWWAWAPFTFYSTVSAEMGTNEVFNQVSKALLIVIVLAWLVPAWRALKRSRQQGRGGGFDSQNPGAQPGNRFSPRGVA